MSVKQVIVVRKDLNMRKWKLAAQVGHASMKVLLDQAFFSELVEDGRECESLVIPLERAALNEWLQGAFTKIVVGCQDEDELLALAAESEKLGFLTAVITDAGVTEFHGIPTKTCVAIGPEDSTAIDELTGHLKLL